MEELKSRMSIDEAMSWVDYKNRRGGLNQSRRIEAAFARAMSFIASAMGTKSKSGTPFTPEDFMPKYEPEEDQQLDSLNDLAKMMKVRR